MDKFKGSKSNSKHKHKHDKDKVDWYLVDMDAVEGMAKVFTSVSESGEYENFSWQTVEPRRYFSALMRHIAEHRKAMVSKSLEDFLDKKSGLPHIDHAMCCLMILRWNSMQELGKKLSEKEKKK